MRLAPFRRGKTRLALRRGFHKIVTPRGEAADLAHPTIDLGRMAGDEVAEHLGHQLVSGHVSAFSDGAELVNHSIW
jgi:hypothetical protein